jgi:hypothetical protein
MSAGMLDFFLVGRSIFGLCPCCGDIFRLSECRVFPAREPPPDWMDELDAEDEKLDRAEERLADREEELREKARARGRTAATARSRERSRPRSTRAVTSG